MKLSLFILLLASVLSLFTYAQDLPAVVTDRPTQSEAPDVVPVGTLLLEAGLLYEVDETDPVMTTRLTAPGLLIRYGLLDYLELRMGMNYMGTRIEYKTLGYDEKFDGFAPLSAGCKIFISRQKKLLPQLAFSGSLIFPGTASNPYEIDHLAASMRLAGSWTVTPVLSIGTNLGIQWDGFVPEGTGFYSLVAGISVYKGLGCFAEFYGYLPERDVPSHLFDAGFTYLLKNNLQFDISGGFGLTPGAPDYFVGTGVSWRVPR